MEREHEADRQTAAVEASIAMWVWICFEILFVAGVAAIALAEELGPVKVALFAIANAGLFWWYARVARSLRACELVELALGLVISYSALAYVLYIVVVGFPSEHAGSGAAYLTTDLLLYVQWFVAMVASWKIRVLRRHLRAAPSTSNSA